MKDENLPHTQKSSHGQAQGEVMETQREQNNRCMEGKALSEFRIEISDGQHFTASGAGLHAYHGTGGRMLRLRLRRSDPERELGLAAMKTV